MNDFQTRFDTMKQALGITRNADFARLLGVEPQNVHNWVKTRQRIGADSRRLFQEKTGISFDWLNDGLGEMWLAATPQPTPAKKSGLTVREPSMQYLDQGPKPGYIRFGIMEGTASAGAGSVNQDYPDVLESVDIAEWQVKQLLGYIPAKGRVQMVTVRGDSNWPKIKNGDVVFIDTHIRHFDGDAFYLINLHGFTMLKRLQLKRDGMHVRSMNPAYESEIVAPGEFDQIHIGGRMLSAAQFRRSEEL